MKSKNLKYNTIYISILIYASALVIVYAIFQQQMFFIKVVKDLCVIMFFCSGHGSQPLMILIYYLILYDLWTVGQFVNDKIF